MNHVHTRTTKAATASDLVGTWRRFGAAGPVYEVIGAGAKRGDGERMVRVRVVESGEELDYRLAELMDDPREG